MSFYIIKKKNIGSHLVLILRNWKVIWEFITNVNYRKRGKYLRMFQGEMLNPKKVNPYFYNPKWWKNYENPELIRLPYVILKRFSKWCRIIWSKSHVFWNTQRKSLLKLYFFCETDTYTGKIGLLSLSLKKKRQKICFEFRQKFSVVNSKHAIPCWMPKRGLQI